MKPTIQLINALRRAADRIERSPSDYNWCDFRRCNCGILAQELTGIRGEQFQDAVVMDMQGAWSNTGKRYEVCSATGLPINEIFKVMALSGIDRQDFADIENLLDTTTRERAGVSGVRYYDTCLEFHAYHDRTDPTAVIRYFRAQADILEEQLAEQFETRELKPLSPVSPPAKQVNATDGLAHGSGTACQLAERQA